MKKLSIKTAILVPSLVVLIVGISIMSAVAGVLSSNTANTLTNQLIETKVDAQANEFKELCGGIYEVVAAATPIVAKFAEPTFAEIVPDPRAEVMGVLSKILMSNDNIIAMWTCWEPNAFDGKDSQYANISFYDASGRFVPYLYKDGSSYQTDALIDYDDPVAGEYYQGALGTGKPFITDPYVYQVGDVETLICSIAIPIIQNGKAAGVVGVDVDLQDFMTLMNSVDILKDGYMFTLSPRGLFASHTEPSLQMKHYTSTWMKSCSEQIEKILQTGGNISARTYSDVIGADIDFFASGVMIGDTGRYWLVCGVVPEKTVSASSVSLLWTIIAIGFALIIVVGATIFLLVHSRLKTLPKLTTAAEAIATGDIDLKGLEDGAGRTKNEISLLERAFFKMANGIRQQADILSRISQGDYSMTIPIRSSKDVINQAISHMLDSTNQTLDQINTSSSQVSIGSKQVADSAQSLAKGASEQAASMEELSISINEITGKTSQNAKIAREAAILSDDIQKKAEKGSAQMSQMMQAVNEIKDASSQIEKVIKVIDDIAFQTNILALNAAVEAARAGQHGKGFAVVAEEVRSLAAKSATSASDTGVMIQNAMEKANLGLVIADETAQSLQEIIDGIKRSANIVAQIEQATDDQVNAISQINTGIGQVSQVIQQNSAASEESAAASEQMSEQSESLIELTSQFTLKSHDQV